MRSLLTSFCIMFLLLTGCDENHNSRGYEYMPDMAHSVAYEAFSPNPNTADGKTLQRPVSGTISRNHMPIAYSDDREKAGQELKNPFPSTEDVLARGKQLFETFCVVCHGTSGQGDGPIIPKFPPPPSLTADRIRSLPDGEIYHAITMGAGLMPSYGSQIMPEDSWKLISYVRVIQGRE